MHSEFSLLEVSFELLLFSLFAYKLYDFGKAYLVPLLYQTLSEEKNLQTEILEKEKLLISTHHRLENQIQQQKRTFLLLEKKVQTWHIAAQKEIDQLKKEEALRLEQLKSKRIIQRTNIAHMTLVQHTVSDVLQTAIHELKEQYNEEAGKQQLTTLVHAISSHNVSKNHD